MRFAGRNFRHDLRQGACRSAQQAAIFNPPLAENPAPLRQAPQIPGEDLGPPVYRPFPSEEYPSEQFDVDPSQELQDLFQRLDRGLQQRKLLPPQRPSPTSPLEERHPLPPSRRRMLAAESIHSIDPAIVEAALLNK
jgi:hypothetical protein